MESNRWLSTAVSGIFLAGAWAVKDVTPPASAPQKGLKVVVIGRAVSPECLPAGDPAQARLQRIALVHNDSKKADGCAIAAGANAAFGADRWKDARSYFHLEYLDDGDNEQTAEELARRIEADPDVLAVIGHTASSTTRLAAPYYSEAGIPLLMPVATSQDVDHPSSRPRQRERGTGPALPRLLDLSGWADEHWDSESKLPNVFRLIPNDRRAQVPALAYVASRITTGETILVADVIEDREYALPLQEGLKSILGKRKNVKDIIIDKNALLDKDLLDQRSDDLLDAQLVVFCGTKERAEAMLASLVKRRARKPGPWPVFLLSDSSRPMSDIPGHLNVLVTFPVGDFSNAPNPDQTRVLQAAVYAGGSSYEVFAYDAVMLLSKVVSDIREHKLPVNRATISKALSRVQQFSGGYKYSFSDGENIHPAYFVFSAGPSVNQLKPCGDVAGQTAPPSADHGVLVFDCAIAPDSLADFVPVDR